MNAAHSGPAGQAAPAAAQASQEGVAQEARLSEAAPEPQPEQRCCGHCGAQAPEGAAFCGECGESLAAAFCPHCHARVLPEGDICEACGGSLLPGQCRFCYAPVPDGSGFCSECGCSQSGISCPACGTLNFFDFCSHCNTPLTQAAQAAAGSLAADPQLSELFDAMQQASREAPSPSMSAESSAPAAVAPTPARRGMFSDQQRNALQGLSSLVRQIREGEQARQDAEQVRREAEAARDRAQADLEHRQQAEKEDLERRLAQSDLEREAVARQAEAAGRIIVPLTLIQSTLDSTAARVFADAQESRRFHRALIASIPRLRPQQVRGWLCNRYNCLHPNPTLCAAPQFGGKWIVEPD